MKIKAEYTAQLKVITGVSMEHYDISANSGLLQLIKVISDKHGEKFRDFVLTGDGLIMPSIMISINNEQVYAEDSIYLKENDTVSFLSPMAGG